MQNPRTQEADMTQEQTSRDREDLRCRTQHINDNFSSCLTEEKRCRCNYAFLFGDDYLCTHPKHREFE
ncbi:hypothetical protein GPEL0_01r1373 [Geoanaerobacter pelophilus]|uniref:Uncharacterized protein n=2 Tax=Geoanaerobacter pelophilus TaxID=60036 RepID=A0ABQ0MJ03_9BACT|nr:hypothetical protein GPEL0_01r1373 [Geoanaerobacter pelophilus]